jgi:alpha-L-fucosidase
MSEMPGYLQDYASAYEANPRAAALEWFTNAKFGLFLHYGLYSVIARRSEWVMYHEKIRPSEYAKVADEFTAEGFDAEFIAKLAVDSGMKYVNITTRHHDSFCLWDTKQIDFSSVKVCGRDLVAELAQACDRHGLGLFLYYSHGRDWKHPHAPNNDKWGGLPRPEYDPPEESYASDDHDLNIYLDFMRAQITELLTNYGPIAGIWLDGIALPLSGDWSVFGCDELYDYIHSLQPQVLVSYKQGLTGREDFHAPEFNALSSKEKPGEICATLCPTSWGYTRESAGTHHGPGRVWDQLRDANARGYNLLINTGPLPDGSIDPEDIPTLQEIGRRLRG